MIVMSACSVDDVNTTDSDTSDNFLSQGEVAFSAIHGSNVNTRTSLGEDLMTTNWSNDDKIYLWGFSTYLGTTIYENCEFSLKWYGTELNDAIFIGNAQTVNTINTNYDLIYFAVYPEPISVSGTTVTYNLPDIQNGKYGDGEYDIMYAGPEYFDAFVDGEKSDLTMSFNHLMHSLYITVPEGRNLLNDPISSLEISFPTDVVGDLSFSVTGKDVGGYVITGDPAVTLSNGASVIEVQFDEPLQEGESMWVFINPTSINGTVEFRAVGESGLLSQTISTTINKDMLAGSVTPITLTIPEQTDYYVIGVDIDENNLGEDPTMITFTAPSGALFSNGTNTFTAEYSIEKSCLLEFAEKYAYIFDGGTIEVSFDSPNAITTASISCSNLSSDVINYYNVSVPYLLYEDFATINTYSSNDNPSVGSATISTGDKDVIDLSTVGLSTSGWTATRTGGESGNSVRIAARYENGVDIVTMSPGRIDSPSLSKIKSGCTPNVTVKYNFKGGRYSKYNSFYYNSFLDWGYTWYNGGDGDGYYQHGYTTDQSISGGSEEIDNVVGTSMLLDNTGGGASSSTQSFTITVSDATTASFEIPGATSSTRASWKVTTDMSYDAGLDGYGANGNFWLYLDNVVVSISE